MLSLREPRLRWCPELWCGLTAVGWAALVYTAAERSLDPASMRVLLVMGDGRMWLILGCAVGAGQMLSLLFRRRLIRWIAMLTQGWFWCLLTLGVWAAVPWTLAAGVYGAWCATVLIAAWRLGGDPGGGLG